MAIISNFPDRRVVEQEASEWLIRLDGDTPPNSQELEALSEWLGRSPVHREELESLNAFWTNNVLTELVVPLGAHKPRLGSHLRDRWNSSWNSSWNISAFATAAAVCSVFIFSIWMSSDQVSGTNGLYVTAVGQQNTVVLADGSTVTLNTNSQIEVAYTEDFRNIRLLQGQAYFDVAKDEEHPFRVYAGAGRVQAVGTAFTVYLKETGVDVLVSEGRVSLSSLGVSAFNTSDFTASEPAALAQLDPYINGQAQQIGILDAGQSITLDISSGSAVVPLEIVETISTVDEAELSRRESWRTGLLVFSGESLEQVVQEISRYTTVEIEIVDADLKQIQIGGRFAVGDVETMFSVLEANFGLEVNRLSYNRAQLTLADRQ